MRKMTAGMEAASARLGCSWRRLLGRKGGQGRPAGSGHGGRRRRTDRGGGAQGHAEGLAARGLTDGRTGVPTLYCILL